jgi:C4-type Zn-finger protein
MGFMDKVKQQAEQAAAKAKETAGDVQTKRELGKAYDELGRETFTLIESGAVSNQALEAHAAKIRELNAKLEEEAGASAGEPVAASSTESSGPPAMPS